MDVTFAKTYALGIKNSRKKTAESAFQPRSEVLTWTEEDWQRMDEDGFRKLFKGSAVKRTKFSGLNRNIEQNSTK